MQSELDQLQGWMASEEAYVGDKQDDLAAAIARSAELTEQMAPIEEEWLGLQEELEMLG